MGHAIYTYSDPRCILLKEKAGQLVSNHPEFEKEFKLYCSVERLTPGVFAKVKNNHKVMCANVDMYSGFVYKMLGIPTEMYTPLSLFQELSAGAHIDLKKLSAAAELSDRHISRWYTVRSIQK